MLVLNLILIIVGRRVLDSGDGAVIVGSDTMLNKAARDDWREIKNI